MDIPFPDSTHYSDAGFDPAQIDSYLAQKGFITKQDADRIKTEAAQLGFQAAWNNFQMWHTIKDTVGKFEGLKDFSSPLSQQTLAILKEKNWANPAEGVTTPGSWEQFQYSGMEAFPLAVELADARLSKQTKESEAAAQAAAQAAQGSGAISGVGVHEPQESSSEDWQRLIDEGKTNELDELIRKGQA